MGLFSKKPEEHTPETVCKEGDEFFNQGLYDQSLEKYQQALQMHTESLQTQIYTTCRVGLCYFALKEYPQALDFFNKTLKVLSDKGPLPPTIPAEGQERKQFFYNLRAWIPAVQAYLHKGMILRVTDKPDEARLIFDDLLIPLKEYTPDQYEAWAMQPEYMQYLTFEQIFRSERLTAITKILKNEGKIANDTIDVSPDIIMGKYKDLGYTEVEINKDLDAASS